MIFSYSCLSGIISIFFIGCAQQNQGVSPSQEVKLTVGIVQKDIKIGMIQANVASVLGSPNIVTSSEQDKETWIYDKVSSNVSYNKDRSGWTLILVGSSSENGNLETSQKTITIIIKFNKGKVYDFKYHTSRF